MATLTAKYKPYPVYKPSGSEWLRDLPAHWEVQRLRHVSEMRVSNVDKHTKEYESPVRLCNYVDVYNNEYITERIEFMSATATLAEIGRFRLKVGDVLITKDSEKWDDIGVPALVQHAADDLTCGYHLALLRSSKSKLDGGYLLRALQSPVVSSQFHVEAKGVTRYGLTHDSVKSVQLPIPPLAEQHAIAAFLDRETGKIDALASKKERLIELLQEKRTALISHTIAKGLDPKAPMKDSGIKWQGEIPAHWETRRVKWVAELNPIRTKERIRLAADTPVTFLPMERVGTDGQIDTCEKVKVSQVWNGYTYFRRGDILVAKITPCFENGKGAHLNSLPTEVGFGSTEFHVLRAKPSVHPQFVYRITTDFAFRQRGTESMTGAAGQQRVSADFVANYQIPLPPLEEQVAIATFLDRETAKLDHLVAQVHEVIELLKELRTALISTAVTGKIDVREEMECT